jgi:hypothetical protein
MMAGKNGGVNNRVSLGDRKFLSTRLLFTDLKLSNEPEAGLWFAAAGIFRYLRKRFIAQRNPAVTKRS